MLIVRPEQLATLLDVSDHELARDVRFCIIESYPNSWAAEQIDAFDQMAYGAIQRGRTYGLYTPRMLASWVQCSFLFGDGFEVRPGGESVKELLSNDSIAASEKHAFIEGLIRER